MIIRWPPLWSASGQRQAGLNCLVRILGLILQITWPLGLGWVVECEVHLGGECKGEQWYVGLGGHGIA